MTRHNIQTHPLLAVAIVALQVVALHLLNATLFHFNAGWPEKVLWALFVLAATAGATRLYAGGTRLQRATIALAFGLPAVMVGAGIHLVHVAQLGFRGSDYTGVPMFAAGLVLSAIGVTLLFRSLGRWWWRAAFVPLALAVLLFLVFPVAYGVSTSNVARRDNSGDRAPEAYGIAAETVLFPTAEDVMLSAWYIPSKNGAAVITVHGSGGHRGGTMAHAALLARNDFGVLMLDLEGFGDSAGKSNAFGWAGVRDVSAAIDYLHTRPEVDPARIGGLGLSMGAEVFITAAAELPDLRAIVSEGASARTWADYKNLSFDGKWGNAPFFYGVTKTTGLLSGYDEPATLKSSMRAISSTRVLLIAANRPEELSANRMFKDVASTHVELWETPESKHTGALALHPEEYEQRIVGFFNTAFEPTTLLTAAP